MRQFFPATILEGKLQGQHVTFATAEIFMIEGGQRLDDCYITFKNKKRFYVQMQALAIAGLSDYFNYLPAKEE